MPTSSDKNGKKRTNGGRRQPTATERAAAHQVIREALVKEALTNPYRMFTAEQVADIMCVSVDMITAIKKHKDSPFPGNKTRPEWVLEWMKNHPEFLLPRSSS